MSLKQMLKKTIVVILFTGTCAAQGDPDQFDAPVVTDIISFDQKLKEFNELMERLDREYGLGSGDKSDQSKTGSNDSVRSGSSYENLDWLISTSDKTVTIGTQIWATKNLDVITFRNGDPIPEIRDAADWYRAGEEKKPAWCYYNNDPAKGEKYGKLYNWFAVSDPRGLAPSGWHIPSESEWKKLMENAAGKNMRSTADNDLAFVPGGYRYDDGASFSFGQTGINGYWWSSTPKSWAGAWGSAYKTWGVCFGLYNGYNEFYSGQYSGEGLSVKCIKD